MSPSDATTGRGARRTRLPLLHLLPLLLALAAGPVDGETLYEIGANDFRVSSQGGLGDPEVDALRPGIAFNPEAREYLVVWHGDAAAGANDDFEIFGRLLDADGGPLGGDFQISSMGPPGDGAYDAFEPDVVFHRGQGEFFVVWHGDDDSGGLVDDEYEIWARRVAANGAPVGPQQRISDVGGTGDPAYGAFRPRVTLDSIGRYVVVWFGDDFENGQVDDEYEIFGQLLTATGVETGPNDFLMTAVDGLGSASTGASEPEIAFAPGTGFVLVYQADAASFGLPDDKFEIFAKIVTDFDPTTPSTRISFTGLPADPARDAFRPTVSLDGDRYLIAWESDLVGFSLADDEFEIIATIVSDELEPLTGIFRVSHMHGTGDPAFDALHPQIGFDSGSGRFVVVWLGDESIDEEYEIWGRVVRSSNGALEGDARPLSDAGGFGQATPYVALYPSIAFDPTGGGTGLVAWSGDDDTPQTVVGEYEIWGQRLLLALFADGFESGDTSAWSSTVP